jgi:putative methyltransferase (TIGR04325 family)
MTTWFRSLAVRLLPPIVTDAIRASLHRNRDGIGAAPAPEAQPTAIAAAETSNPAQCPAQDPTKHAAAPPEWEVVEDTDAMWAALGGWDDSSIVQTQRDKWQAFLGSVEGPGVLGKSHEATSPIADLATHNTIITFGYALARAGAGRERLSILDWGGGLGHYYHYARALLPGVALDYTVKDMPGLCSAGRELIPQVSFSADESVLRRQYDFVFASSAVHYERDPYRALGRLAAATSDWLLVTRTPILERTDDLLVVQRPYAYGYMTEYAGWMMNRSRLVDCLAQNGFTLERQFLIGEQPYLPMLDEQPQYYGFLFRRT